MGANPANTMPVPASPPPARVPVAATPIAFVRCIVAAYGRYGRDAGAALHQAQIAPALLHQADAQVTAGQFEQLSECAMRELDDEGLGWFERRLPWGSYGMLARASISAPNLKLALARWCRHHGLLTHCLRLQVQVEGARARIVVDECADLGPWREFCLVSVLRNIHGLACWLVDSRIAVLDAQFPFARPAHASAYAVLFSGPTIFAAPGGASVAFDARYLNLALRRDEAALTDMLQHALPLTVRQYRRDRLLVQRVRQALAQGQQAPRTAAALAAALNLSVRTLHRQLREQGTSLQHLRDNVRQAQALEWLQRTQRPLKQVAQACGFRNEKSFARAFRTWTGQSPGAVRRQADPEPPSGVARSISA